MDKLKSKKDIHWERKVTHVLGILFIYAVYTFTPAKIHWLLLAVAGSPFVIFDFMRFFSPTVMKLSQKYFGRIMRTEEMTRMTGTSYLMVGVAIAILFFSNHVVSLSLLFLAIADPIASIVGIRHGKDKIIFNKSLQGTTAAFVTCIIIALCYFYNHQLMTERLLAVGILAGAIGAFSEMIAVGWLDDNFTQPVFNSILLTLLFHAFGGMLPL